MIKHSRSLPVSEATGRTGVRYAALAAARFYPAAQLMVGNSAGQRVIGSGFQRSGDTLDCEFAGPPTNRDKRCYCGVTTGEFVVPVREQMRTGDNEGN